MKLMFLHGKFLVSHPNKFSPLLKHYQEITFDDNRTCWPGLIFLKPHWNYFSAWCITTLSLQCLTWSLLLCGLDRKDCYFNRYYYTFPLLVVVNRPRALTKKGLAIVVFYGSHDFFCQNSVPWMLLRNVGIKSKWKASTAKSWPNLVSVGFYWSANQVVNLDLVEVVFSHSVLPHQFHLFYFVYCIHLVPLFHTPNFWYCKKSLWYPVSPRLGQNHPVLCLMWTLLQNCYVATGMLFFSLCGNTRWDSPFGSLSEYLLLSIVFWVVG